ncbi:hypothetical protein Sjap_008201 [Stephania japonica]|uniref:Uncharacterized protein n=1 Tax=Stephania japonica TaxID=461633 RepID=A0AAP0JP61_9MAGN
MCLVIDGFSVRVIEEHNTIILQEFTAEEVKSAIFLMHPNKSPNEPNVLSTLLAHYWQRSLSSMPPVY